MLKAFEVEELLDGLFECFGQQTTIKVGELPYNRQEVSAMLMKKPNLIPYFEVIN